MRLTGLIDGDGRLFMKLDLIDNKQITITNSCPVNIDSNIDPFNNYNPMSSYQYANIM